MRITIYCPDVQQYLENPKHFLPKKLFAVTILRISPTGMQAGNGAYVLIMCMPLRSPFSMLTAKNATRQSAIGRSLSCPTKENQWKPTSRWLSSTCRESALAKAPPESATIRGPCPDGSGLPLTRLQHSSIRPSGVSSA